MHIWYTWAAACVQALFVCEQKVSSPGAVELQMWIILVMNWPVGSSPSHSQTEGVTSER